MYYENTKNIIRKSKTVRYSMSSGFHNRAREKRKMLPALYWYFEIVQYMPLYVLKGVHSIPAIPYISSLLVLFR